MTLRPLNASASNLGGRPLLDPFRLRFPTWSEGSAMTAVIPRERSRARLPREEYALSPRIASGRVRGRPGPVRGTRIAPSRLGNIGESFACPGPRSSNSGRPLLSRRWWILVLSPPRERLTAWSAGSSRPPDPSGRWVARTQEEGTARRPRRAVEAGRSSKMRHGSSRSRCRASVRTTTARTPSETSHLLSAVVNVDVVGPG